MKNVKVLLASICILFLAFPAFSQWDINGNTVNAGEKFGSLNNADVNFFSNDLFRMTLKANGFLGLGTQDPNAWQEINYCPPVGTPQSGLIVTKHNCNNSSGVTMMQENISDVIGKGIVFSNSGGGSSGEGNNGSGGTGNVFNVPFSFKTGNFTNLITPLYSPEMPMFWVRQRKPKLSNPWASPVDEYDTKFIVMPDGSCGINVTQPRAALDVRGSQGYNRPSAIIGSRAMGTGSIDPGSGLYQYYTQQVQFVPRLKENGYNQIVKDEDQGMFFSDGKGAKGANSSGSFVLAPWVEAGDPNIGGMRMDANGNTEFHGTIRATEVKINAQWWSDFVFADDYGLMSLGEVEQYISKNKHLPNVPSEAEVLKDGINVADMQAIQQQKIEELTLYLIQLKKEVDLLKAELAAKN